MHILSPKAILLKHTAHTGLRYEPRAKSIKAKTNLPMLRLIHTSLMQTDAVVECGTVKCKNL